MSIPPKVLAGVDRLAPLPATANRLIAILEGDDDPSLAEVASVIEFDPVMAARVLRIARSAAYSGRVPPHDVRAAVIRLGTETVLDLVLGDYLKTLRVTAPLYDLAEDELWAHGAAAALAARALARERQGASLPPLAQTAALMHDIGKLVMVRTLDARPSQVTAHCEANGVTWVEGERALFGCDHAEVGGALARHWGLPEELASAIARHHDVPVADPDALVDTVILANLVAKSIGVGLGAEGLNLRIDPGLARRLSVDFTTFSRVCMQAAAWMKELQESYQIVPVRA
ncbi:MAG: HDOD domain-containing protein [Vicinamibacterales bacterium]